MKLQVPLGKGDEPLPTQELQALPQSLGGGKKQVGVAGSERLFICGGKDIWDQPPGLGRIGGLGGEEGA